MLLTDSAILRLIQFAIHEDVGSGDITTEFTVPSESTAAARFVAKQNGVICGLPILPLVFREFSPDVELEVKIDEGARIEANTIIATVQGPAHALLAAERTALNFLQRMSGVATKTASYVERIRHTRAKVLDTRKTIPGWRKLDKYATSIGGAVNHRVGLFDMIMIKDNHITACGGIREAIESVIPELKNRPGIRVEVEARNLEDVHEILTCAGVNRIMFDNFTPHQVREGVKVVDGALETEASGGITYDNIIEYAEAGVDYISVGAITHSAVALDISMKLYVPKQG